MVRVGPTPISNSSVNLLFMDESAALHLRFQKAVEAQESGQMARTRVLYRQLLREAPDFADVVHALGLLEVQTGDVNEGLALLERSVRLAPGNPRYHNNLGEIYRLQKRMALASECFRTCIALDPTFAAAHTNLANILQSRGDVPGAIVEYRKAIALDPKLAIAHSNLLLTMHFDPSNTPEEIFAEHLRWGEAHGRPAVTLPELPPINPSPRRLRVGYVSPDFAFHPVGFFLEPILERHDRERFEIFCYSDVPKADHVTNRMKSLADHWFDSSFLPDQLLAERIREDRIDILLDLAGHTARNRLRLFAARLAPLQITYLGYPDTTGLKSIDFRITDPVLNPPSPPGFDDRLHTEELFRLPGPFACYRPFDESPDVEPEPPVTRKGYITFGCPTRLEKVSPVCVRWWSQVLAAVPNSRLLMMGMPSDDPEAFDYMGAVLSESGIDMGRVNFIHRQNFFNYLLAHNSVDLIMGSFPSNGHTIVCHAMWMGVPTVPMTGNNCISRLTSSVLTCLGLPELIATSPEQYIQIATDLARDIPRLTELRQTLRQRMAASDLLDHAGFTRKFESALHQMWETRVAELS
jgi:protein O-GlcNAc transferase